MLIKALAFKVQECTESLQGRDIGMALYGLRRLDDSREARKLLAALTTKVQSCPTPFSAVNLANALYGLQSLGDSREAMDCFFISRVGN